MSYWIYLIPEGSSADGPYETVPHFQEGGTQVLGGSDSAELNVTYNYAKHFDFRSLHKKVAFQTVAPLAEAIMRLNTDVDKNDYWNPTEGNVRLTLKTLLSWAGLHPFSWWYVS
jgi:hypothetical protein